MRPGDDRDRDERPRRSWREIDQMRDGSRGRSGDERRPRGAAAEARAKAATQQYLKHADELFAPTNVRARFFTVTGGAAAVGNASITSFANGDVYGPHVVYLCDDGALVTYGVQTTSDDRFAAGAIAFTRFGSPSGNRVGADVIVPAELPSFNPVVPAIAQRPDGALAAVWHQCGPGGDGQDCGVLMQLLRATGSPVGAPRLPLCGPDEATAGRIMAAVRRHQIDLPVAV